MRREAATPARLAEAFRKEDGLAISALLQPIGVHEVQKQVPRIGEQGVEKSIFLAHVRSTDRWLLDYSLGSKYELSDNSTIMLDRDWVTGLALLDQASRDADRVVKVLGLVEAILGSFADDVVCAARHDLLLHSVNVDPEVVQHCLWIDTGNGLRVGEGLQHEVHLRRGLSEPDGW
jgi:hypothetical protein